MTKAEKLTIAILAVTLACSMYLLFKPEPSGDPNVGDPAPAITNTTGTNENPEAENGQ